MANEGVRGLYRAYFATITSFGPFSALFFMFYEKFKCILVFNNFRKYLLRPNQTKLFRINYFIRNFRINCRPSHKSFRYVKTSNASLESLKINKRKYGKFRKLWLQKYVSRGLFNI